MVAMPVALATAVAAVLLFAGCGSGDDAGSGSGPAKTVATGKQEAAEPPARIVALTARGDVVVIDRGSGAREARLGSFPWEKDGETGIIYGRAEDLTVLPGGGALVDTCCEPAAGTVYLLEGGERAAEVNGWDPQVDASGTRVAIAGILGIAIHEAPLALRPSRMLRGDPATMPEDPAWSLDGRELAFTLDGRLGRLPVSAGSLAEAEILEPADGAFWSSPAYTTKGIVAVEQSGAWPAYRRSGPSRLMAVDLETGTAVELARSEGLISDVNVDASGRYVLWVDSGRLRWEVDGVAASLDGNFVAAAWARPD